MKTKKHPEQYIPLYLCGELDEFKSRELEVHLQYCEQCRQLLAETRALHQLLERKPVPEPTEALLTRARNRLRQHLQAEQRQPRLERWKMRITELLPFPGGVLQIAGAAALFVFGLLVGRFMPGMELPQTAEKPLAVTLQQDAASDVLISQVDQIQYDPASGKVTVQYKAVHDVALEGNLDDPDIRRVLAHAIRSEAHPGRRLNAVKATSAEMVADPELQAALIHAMLNDEVEGVRLRAGAVLRKLPLNQASKQAFIQVLLKDPNPAVRMEALTALDQAKYQDDVVPIFRNAAEDDENEFVRLQASRVLARLENPQVDQE